MSFFIFFIYLTISFVIYGVIGVLIYKLTMKKKKDDFDALLDSVFNNEESEEKKNDKIYSSF